MSKSQAKRIHVQKTGSMPDANCTTCHHAHADWKGDLCRLWQDYPTPEQWVMGCKYYMEQNKKRRPCRWES